MGGFFKELWPFGKKDDEPKPRTPRTPSPGAGTTPVGPGNGTRSIPVDAPPPVTSVPVDAVPTVPHPAPIGGDLHVRTKVNGVAVKLNPNAHGNMEPEFIVVKGGVGSKIPLTIEIEMDPLTDPALYAELVDDFRDKLPLPGSAELRLIAWPKTHPRFEMGDIKAVGTVNGQAGGFESELEDTPGYKHLYLANITKGLLTFTVTTTLKVLDEGASYAVIKGQVYCPAGWGDERDRFFEVWLNAVRKDFA